jgi:hypothetical protein
LRRSELHLASSAPPPSPHRCSMASYSTAVDQPTCAPLGVSWSVDQQWRAPKWGLGSKRKSKSRQLSSCFSFPCSRDLISPCIDQADRARVGCFHQNPHVLMNSTNP